MKNIELNIINKILIKYLSEEDFHKLKNYLTTLDNKQIQQKSLPKSTKRTVSQAKFVKYSKLYASNIISFIKENSIKAERSQFLFSLANEFNEAGFNDAALKLFIEALQLIDHQHQSFYGYTLLKIGKIYSEKGYRKKSNSYVKKASKIFNKLNDIDGLIQCFNLLGCNYIENCQLIEATVNLKKCLHLLNVKKNNLLKAKIEMNLAGIYLLQGNYELSLYYSQCALLKFEKLNDYINIVMLRYNIASNYYEMGELDKALKEYDKSLTISMKHNLIFNIGRVYHDKARIFLKFEDIKMAMAYWQKGAEIFDRTNDPSLKFLLMMLKGVIYRKQGQYIKAEKCLLENRESLKKFNNQYMIADNELELGYLYRDWGNKNLATDYFRNSLQLFTKRNSLLMMERIKKEIKML